jgi:ribonuclease HI
MRYAVRLHFPTSNNMAEYEALLCSLRIAIETGIKRLDVRGYSQLVIDQVLTVKIRQPSHEFTYGVGISFIPYPLVLTPVV